MEKIIVFSAPDKQNEAAKETAMQYARLSKEEADRSGGQAGRAGEEADRAKGYADRIDLGVLDAAVLSTGTDAETALLAKQASEQAAATAADDANAQITPNVSAAVAAKNAAEAAKALSEAAALAAVNSNWTYIVADNAALLALSGMTADQTAFVKATERQWKFEGGVWVDKGPSVIADKAPLTPFRQIERSVEGAEQNAGNMFTGEMEGDKFPIAGSEKNAVMWWDNTLQAIDGIFKDGTLAAAFMSLMVEKWAKGRDMSTFEAVAISDGKYPVLPVGENGRQLGWYDAVEDEVRIPKLAIDNAVYYQRPARLPLPTGMRFTLTNTTIYGHLSYGQSLSIGAMGKDALTISQPFGNLTFAAGPKTTLTGNGHGGNNQSAMDAFKPLVEDNLSPDANSSRGETVCSGTVNGAVELAIVESGISPASLVMFASACGKGGETILNLLKTSAPEVSEIPDATQNYYANFINHVTRAKAVATAMGKEFVVTSINWTQGEADSGMALATYKGHLVTLIADMQADVKAITGQSISPHILLNQQASGVASGSTGGPPQAAFELARDREDCHLCGPIYHLPVASDGTHLTNVGYARLGRYFARALKSILVDGLKPLQFRPVSAVLKGSKVYVRFDVPTPPMVLDYDALAATTNAGFAVRDDNGTCPITGVSVAADGVTLVIALDAPPAANPVLRCGIDHLGAGLVINNGGSTNLRDSTADPIFVGGQTYPTWNVCPHARLPIIKIN